MIELEVYIKEIVQFLQTVTLKNTYFADQIRTQWVNAAFRNKLPEQYNPYYKHLNGEYIFKNLNKLRSVLGDSAIGKTDEELCRKYGISLKVDIDGVAYSNSIVYDKFDDLIVVNSFDTKLPIPFMKTVLSDRSQRTSASVYRIPSTYYYSLCDKYPEQIDLIRGIVYPIGDINGAIKAPNYSVLSCDLNQLEKNEQSSLYSAMLQALSVIRRRWDVREFVYEELYALSMQGKIWSVLLGTLFSQRIKNIHTTDAHPYHIWRYLESHGIPNSERALTKKQALFLYKNFNYLLRHCGTDSNLILLAHRLLSEWNISIYEKRIIQSTDGMLETVTPEIRVASNEIEPEIMTTLRHIDKRETSYTNKTQIAIDELNAMRYTMGDTEKIVTSSIESLDDLLKKEQETGIEYQDDQELKLSKDRQLNLYQHVPTTQLQTKILEFRNIASLQLFQQLYSRYITEAFYYRMPRIEQVDEDIEVYKPGIGHEMLNFKFSNMAERVYLEAKDVLILFLYCELQATGMYEPGMLIPNGAHTQTHNTCERLTVPWKESFSPIPEMIRHKSSDYKTAHYLSIIPNTIRITSDTLPEAICGDYKLTNPDDPISDWTWVYMDNALRFIDRYGGDSHWELISRNVTDGTSFYQTDIVLKTMSLVAYSGWTNWKPIWEYVSEEGTVVRYTSDLTVTDYTYVLDKIMPATVDSITTDAEDTLYAKTMHLLDEQATSYVALYRELHSSGSSVQHTMLHRVLSDRTFNGWIKLKLSEYRTFDEYIHASPFGSKYLLPILQEDDQLRKRAFSELADDFIKLLIPIESDYMAASVSLSAMRYQLIKNLMMSLCSYNITFLDGGAFAEPVVRTIPCVYIYDEHSLAYGRELNIHVKTDLSTFGITEYTMTELFCYDAVYRIQYTIDHERTYTVGPVIAQVGSLNHREFIASVTKYIVSVYPAESAVYQMEACEHISGRYLRLRSSEYCPEEFTYQTITVPTDILNQLYTASCYTEETCVVVPKTTFYELDCEKILEYTRSDNHPFVVDSAIESVIGVLIQTPKDPLPTQLYYTVDGKLKLLYLYYNDGEQNTACSVNLTMKIYVLGPCPITTTGFDDVHVNL